MSNIEKSGVQSDSIVITGIGMISSIGRDVITSCASARAGITRECELECFSVFDEESDELFPLAPAVGHATAGFSDGFVGLGRLVRLGHAALCDLINYADIRETSFAQTGFLLNLSSGYYLNLLEAREKEELQDSGQSDEDLGSSEMEIRRYVYGISLISKLCELSGITVSDKFQELYFRDHAGIVAAIAEAIGLLKRDELDRCIVGGIDSYVDQESLEILSQFGVLKTVENPVGFIPGEAAAFILLERYDKALRRNARIQGILESPSVKTERQHRFSDQPSSGVALYDAVSATLEGLTGKGRGTGLIIGTLNGDPTKAKEWGNALVRLSAKYPIGDCEQWYPAVSFGETGAATGAISICMGVRAFVRNYVRGDNILIWLGNDDGYKGSIYLRKYQS